MELETKPAIHGEVEAGRSAKCRAEIENLVHSINTNTFDLAEVLYEAQSSKFYYTWGFNTFAEFIKDIDLKTSKARYLARMVEIMNAVGIAREVYEPVGVSKLREITSLDPAGYWINDETGETEKLDGWIIKLTTAGKEMSLSEIKELVKKLKGLTGEDELIWLNICVKKIVLENTIRPALDLMKKVIGSKGRDEDGNAIEASDGEALEGVCAGFLLDPNNQSAAESQEVGEE